MKKIDLKNPRYVIPLICLPFLLLLFYVYRLSISKVDKSASEQDGLKTEISAASAQVTGKGIEDKLEAFKQRYKKSDGYSAVGALDISGNPAEGSSSVYNAKEKQLLDSISLSLKNAARKSSAKGSISTGNFPGQSYRRESTENRSEDRQLSELLSKYAEHNKNTPSKQADPMAIFRAQMAIVDSMNKASLSPRRPANKAFSGQSDAPQRPLAAEPLQVTGLGGVTLDSSTITAKGGQKEFIQGIIDQTLVGYSGSRVTIRLLSDVRVGMTLLKKGTLLYALINGFSPQRVLLSISSIAFNGEILPVNLEVYDLDGIKGIYIPASLYREFSRELASNGITGLSAESSGRQNEQIMSLLGRMFQSTQGAVNKLIRSNKAKINYPSRIYLLDKSLNKTRASL
ncbi:conjugative transposon protein TraM [Pedobacter jamesrossensis]|uniref:Conjugative transposon protein TraM n=1 Tax=Pedobacter jamesrossensis TaxID=1908238 RepID=A0ABV8NR73_9SPHI